MLAMGENFGENLARLRKAAGWTQIELADAARLSVRTIISAESAKDMRLQPGNFDKLINSLSSKLKMESSEVLAALAPVLTPKTPDGFVPAETIAPRYHDAELSRADPSYGQQGHRFLAPAPAGSFIDYQAGALGDQFLPAALFPYRRGTMRTGVFPVVGDSMAPRLKTGDLVLCVENLRPRPGDLAVVKLRQDRGHTIKQLGTMTDKHWELLPVNPDFRAGPPVVVTEIEAFARVVVEVRNTFLRDGTHEEIQGGR